jgi:hypothetical protein
VSFSAFGAPLTPFSSASSLSSSSGFDGGASHCQEPLLQSILCSTAAPVMFQNPFASQTDYLACDLSAVDHNDIVTCSSALLRIKNVLKPIETHRIKGRKGNYHWNKVVANASIFVIDGVVAAGAIPFLSKALASKSPELLLSAFECLEVIAAASREHCDSIIKHDCCRQMLSVINFLREDVSQLDDVNVIMMLALKVVGPIVSCIVAQRSEAIEHVNPVLFSFLAHSDSNVRLKAIELVEVISGVSHSSWISKMNTSVDFSRLMDLWNDKDVMVSQRSLRIVRNFLRSGDADMCQRLISCHDCAPRLAKILHTPLITSAASGSAASAPTGLPAPFPLITSAASGSAASAPTGLPAPFSAAEITLDIICAVTDCFSKTRDDGRVNAVLLWLMQGEVFDAVIKHVPNSVAPAKVGSAEFFATQLITQHIAPYMVSGMSCSTGDAMVGAVRQHLASKKPLVIKACVDSGIIPELFKLLSSTSSSVIEHSLACLKSLVALRFFDCDAVVAHGLLVSLLELFVPSNIDANRRQILKDARNLLTLIIKRRTVDSAVLLPVFSEICRLVSHADSEVQREACLVLVAMTDSGYSAAASQHVDPSYIALLLNSPDSRICALGSRILNNFVQSADADIVQRLLACHDCAPHVTKCLKPGSTFDCGSLVTVDCSNFKPERALDALKKVISSGELLL